ncbi:hypothetical protein LguiA_015664 [Lonicera macranthoides]
MGREKEEEEEKVIIRKQLAAAVKRIQWSYSIFWSLSSTLPGVLEWGDGYYNGDIKTRKTVQSAEKSTDDDDDEFGLERTKQLRELYESLSAETSNIPQAKRPSASLSPEDLTNAEWYFLVCMSFLFNIGLGLPGITLSNNQTVWLCNAHHADSKDFSRSLLAKTVVCFPYLGGVVELGVTEQVLEDPNIIQHIKASFLKIPCEIAINEREFGIKMNQDISIHDDTNLVHVIECEEVNNIRSPDKSSSKFEPVDQQAEENSFVVEGVNGEASQVQSWQFMDDEISNCLQISTSCSDFGSQNLASIERGVSHSNIGEKVTDGYNTELTSFDCVKNDGHYQTIISTLLGTSDRLILGPCSGTGNGESSFVSWKKRELSASEGAKDGGAQRLLKKVLLEVGQMHSRCLVGSREENWMRDKLWRPKVDEIDTNHVLLERKRRERINEKFFTLGELVPCTSKVDKVSVLDNTIKYLKELKQRVTELESCKVVPELEETRRKNKPRDVVERTSDNYGYKRMINKSKKTLRNKRKACDIQDMMEGKNNRILTKDDSIDDVTVSKIEKNVLIEIRCHWRQNLLLEIIGATSNLHLDSHSVHSSNVDGILSLTIKAQSAQTICLQILPSSLEQLHLIQILSAFWTTRISSCNDERKQIYKRKRNTNFEIRDNEWKNRTVCTNQILYRIEIVSIQITETPPHCKCS